MSVPRTVADNSRQHIPGTDHRIHVVGDEVFACEVRSEADDYRYAERQGAGVEIRPCASRKSASTTVGHSRRP
jgi:hypothetical protein